MCFRLLDTIFSGFCHSFSFALGGEGEKRKETHSKKSGMKALLQNPKHRGLFVSQRRYRGGEPKKSCGKREGDEKERKVGESQGESM